MLLPFVISHELPLTDPVLKFLLILVIILSAPFAPQQTENSSFIGIDYSGCDYRPNGLNLVLRG